MARRGGAVDMVRMCFKKPKAPPPVRADPELARQKVEQKGLSAEERRANKEARLEDRLAQLTGRSGRASMFTGGAGGAGFAAPVARSLFEKG